MTFMRAITVGVDIGLTDVRMVVATRRRGRLVVTASAAAFLPAGTLHEGVIQNAPAFINVLQGLRRQCKLPAYTPVGLSVYSLPGTLKIIPMPAQDSDVCAMTVEQEIRSCMPEASEDLVTDYGRVADPDRPKERVLGIGYDQAVLCRYIEALDKACLKVDWVDSAYLAILRSLYDAYLSGPSEDRQMLLVLRDAELQAGVLQDGVLETVRTRSVREEWDHERHLSACMLEEMHALVQQYDPESDSPGTPWQILIVADHQKTLPRVVQWNLRKTLPKARVTVMDAQAVSALMATDSRVPSDTMSSLALGVALARERNMPAVPTLNLLPPAIFKLKQAEHHRILASLIAAVVMLAMMYFSPLISVRADRIKEDIQTTQSEYGWNEITPLIDRCTNLEAQIQSVQADVDYLKTIDFNQESLDWMTVLQDVRDALPAYLWLTRLEAWQDRGALIIEGQSATYNAIGRFIDALIQCDTIDSVEVIDRELSRNGESVVFSVCCYLPAQEREARLPLVESDDMDRPDTVSDGSL